MKLLTFNGALVSHGGAREGAGPKHKYTDDKGNPLKTKQVRIPEILNENDIQKAVLKKLAESKGDHDAGSQ